MNTCLANIRLEIPLIVSMMTKLILLLLVGATAVTSSCVHKAPEWNCTGLPLINVEFSGTIITTCGDKLPKTLFEELVHVIFSGVDENKHYALIMVDPDAPNSPAGKGWLHLIKAHIPGSTLAKPGDFIGTVVTEYAKPTPPKNTGTHRYFLYLYEEPESRPFMEGVTQRAKFDIQKFVSDYGLCGPVAMNMFITEF